MRFLFLLLFLGSVLQAEDLEVDFIVERVYDGDTFFIEIQEDNFPGVFSTIGIRIRGIDTPEIRTRDESEKLKALISKAVLISLMDNAVVEILNIEKGKYFRIVADVYCNGISVADYMLEYGFAEVYND